MSTRSNHRAKENLLKKILELNALVYIGLSVLEQHVRRAMADLLTASLGHHWLADKLTEPGIPLFKTEAELIMKRKGSRYVLTEEKFVRECSMGFWVELFNPKTYKLLKGIPIQVFANRPATVKRSEIYRRFKILKDLRNELVHNRLLDAGKENILSMVNKLQTADMETRELLSYIDPAIVRLLPTGVEKKLVTLKKIAAAVQ